MSSQKNVLPLSKVQKFEPKRINRTDIKNAEYNPRNIDPHAKRKLEKNLRKVGLLESLVWNERTGNLVSGHQRLAIIDIIEGTPNYSLDVSVTSLSLKEEKRQNVFFNNPGAQGTWDLIALADLAKDDDFDIEDAGFDPMDIEVLFDDIDGKFGTAADEGDQGVVIDPPVVRPTPAEEAIRQRQETQRRHGKESEDEAKARIRSDRAESKERAQTKDDTEFYVVVVFQSRREREDFMKHINHTEEEKYLDGRELCSLLHIPTG
jgi:hypothetical protein